MIPFNYERKNESHEYPGVYHPPSYNWSKVMRQLRETRAGRVKPSVNVSESHGYYCMEVNAPGYKKEDFIVTIEDGTLNIYGLSSACNASRRPGNHVHDPAYDCFEHSVALPAYIDTDFVRAEYNGGVLRFDFPKTDYEHRPTVDRIIIY